MQAATEALALRIALSILGLASMVAGVTWSGQAVGARAGHPVTRAVGASQTGGNPDLNLAATPDYSQSCWSDGSITAQQSTQCRQDALAAINNAHAAEGVRPIELPRNYWSLPVEAQLFVIADLERTSRGLRPVQGLSRQLDRWAATGARHNADPVAPGWRLSSRVQIRAWASNWAADYNSLTADYSWMYLDGWGGTRAATSNVDCTSPTANACWGHRDNILAPFSGSRAVIAGTGHVMGGWDGYFNSYSELFVQYAGRRPHLVYSWRDATRAGAH